MDNGAGAKGLPYSDSASWDEVLVHLSEPGCLGWVGYSNPMSTLLPKHERIPYHLLLRLPIHFRTSRERVLQITRFLLPVALHRQTRVMKVFRLSSLDSRHGHSRRKRRLRGFDLGIVDASFHFVVVVFCLSGRKELLDGEEVVKGG